MDSTTDVLQQMAAVIDQRGLHRGDQFAIRVHENRLTQHDICALAWVVAEGRIAPRAFFTDEIASIRLIEGSEPAMAAIRAISQAITNYAVPDTNGQPDVIEHVSNWANTPPIGETTPPSTAEVIGCILRAADTLAAHTTAA